MRVLSISSSNLSSVTGKDEEARSPPPSYGGLGRLRNTYRVVALNEPRTEPVATPMGRSGIQIELRYERKYLPSSGTMYTVCVCAWMGVFVSGLELILSVLLNARRDTVKK